LFTGGGAPLITDRAIAVEPAGTELGAYSASQVQLAAPLAMEIGVRWDRQSILAQEEISPRVNLMYLPTTSVSMRFAWGRYYQAQRASELQVEDGESQFFPAQLSEQSLVSLEWTVSPRWRFRSDAYLKEMSHLRPRYENLFDTVELFPEGEGDRVRIAPDRAEAKGVELSLWMNGSGRIGGWAALTLASAEDVVDGVRIPRSWDQREAFSFSINYAIPSSWNLNLAGIFHSGWPTTAVTAEFVPVGGGSPTIQPLLGARNEERLPVYYRLDLKASRAFQTGRSNCTFFAEITNLTNHHNVCCVDRFDYLPQSDGTVDVERENGYWLEIVPAVGLIWRWGL
jgi:hypothetical protein